MEEHKIEVPTQRHISEKQTSLGRVMPYTITIIPTANHGFVVNIGCCQLAFAGTAAVGSLLKVLEQYLYNPEECERLYSDSKYPEPRPSGARQEDPY